MNGSQVPIADPAGMKMQRRILHSWKEIASYVGRGIRTIQRYEVQFGLPVHRLVGSSRSAVMAFSDEIDAWLSRTPTLLNDYSVSNGVETCPLCCGTGKISNSRHSETRPDRNSTDGQLVCTPPKPDALLKPT